MNDGCKLNRMSLEIFSSSAAALAFTKLEGKCRCVQCCRITVYHRNRVTLSKPDIWLLLSRRHRRTCYLFEVQEVLTSATGTPSGGRQCNTIMPFRGTSVPWGSCSKFFRRSKGENKQPTLKKKRNLREKNEAFHNMTQPVCRRKP